MLLLVGTRTAVHSTRTRSHSCALRSAVVCQALPTNTNQTGSVALPVYENGVVQVLCVAGLTWTDSSLSTTTKQRAYCLDAGDWTGSWQASKSLSCSRMPAFYP